MFTSLDNTKRYTSTWPVENLKANVLLVHGLGEHCHRYDPIIPELNKIGCQVVAYDHKGHGQSEGRRAYIDKFDDLVKDLDLFWNANVSNEVPNFIYAHSLGGLVAVSFLLKQEIQNIRGVVLSAPLIATKEDMAPMLKKVSGVVGTILPYLKTLKLDTSAISRIKSEVSAYENDPLIYHKGLPARTGLEILRQTVIVQNKLKEFNYPFIALHGTDDQLTEFEGSKKLFEQSISTDKTFVPLDGFYHEFIRDENAKIPIQTISNWIKERI